MVEQGEMALTNNSLSLDGHRTCQVVHLWLKASWAYGADNRVWQLHWSHDLCQAASSLGLNTMEVGATADARPRTTNMHRMTIAEQGRCEGSA